MRKRNLTLLLATFAALLLLTACRTAPIYNVHDAAIPSSQKAPITMNEIEGAIVRAGAGLGWTMSVVAEGHIVATLNIRSHQAVVDINYDERDYSINYKSSYNLKYNGTKIHSQYNNWIRNLTQAINAQVATTQYK